MNSGFEKEFSFLTTRDLSSYLLRIFLLLPLFLILFLQYRKRKNLRHIVENLPSAKTRTYNLLGHLSYAMKYYIFNHPAPVHAYYMIVMTGYTHAYGKNGVAFAWQLTHPGIFVYNADSVEKILNHSTELKKAWFYKYLHPWLGDGLLTTHGPKWKDRRKFLTPAFHFNILKDYLPVINKQANILTNQLQNYISSNSVDIVPLITRCTFDVICESILGEEMHSQTREDCDYLKSVLIISDIIIDRVFKPWLWPDGVFRFTSKGRKFLRHIAKVNKQANELIAKKKKEKLEMKLQAQKDIKKPEEDEFLHTRKRALLDLLLEEHINNNSISVPEIREEVDTFMFEGHDTTAMAISWSLYLIGLYPDVQAKIHAELDSIFSEEDRDPTMDDLRDMKYLECVFKETLRLYPSVPGFSRELQEDMEYDGRIFPKGSSCSIWIYTLHRNPEVFPDPEKFDPERFTPENSAGRHPFAYVPFSAGPRNCIGQRFAMMELKCVVSSILRKYKLKSLQPRDKIYDTYDIVLRPYNGLKLEIRNRE